MHKYQIAKRHYLRDLFLQKIKYSHVCKGSAKERKWYKENMRSNSYIRKVVKRGSFFVTEPYDYLKKKYKFRKLKDKICNDEWTDINENYCRLDEGQEFLLNYDTNDTENSDEFFVPVQINCEDECDICMESYNNGKEVSRLTRCVHMFHTHCIKKACETSQRCPVCRVSGPKLEGSCPPGRMSWRVHDKLHGKTRLAGYEDCGVIAIRYEMCRGFQDGKQQNPGVEYYGTMRDAYLPDNPEGNRVLELFKKAWKMKRSFTVGRSLSLGEDNCITWNDIHHKTDPFPNAQYGYPDPTYLTRVVEDMKAMGIY